MLIGQLIFCFTVIVLSKSSACSFGQVKWKSTRTSWRVLRYWLLISIVCIFQELKKAQDEQTANFLTLKEKIISTEYVLLYQRN